MIAALLALALAAEPCGPPEIEPGPLPFAPGERLTYDLDLLGLVRTGTLQLSVERPLSAGQITPLRARAKTDAALAAFRRITAVAFSWVDARTLRPERYREEAEDRGVHKLGDTRLAPAGPEVEITYRVGDRVSTARHPRRGEVLDPLSALYRLRASALAPGDTYCFDMVARGRLWRVDATVGAAPERRDTPAGEFETIRVEASARPSEPAGAAPRPLQLWISTDAARLPVAIRAEVDAGPVHATLTRAEGARAR